LLARLLPLALACVALVGCAHVAPYEREEMACDCVEAPRAGAYDAFEAHVRSAREGASGTTWTAGGGCGCN
jgi:hypothetical protein